MVIIKHKFIRTTKEWARSVDWCKPEATAKFLLSMEVCLDKYESIANPVKWEWIHKQIFVYKKNITSNQKTHPFQIKEQIITELFMKLRASKTDTCIGEQTWL